ncbi:hypothetical protein EJP617_09850 [Erwinia sp. Ejp617]|nr:hypothetical protein EJP617_09850 [Erwinia sp. Ejp617]
MSGERGAAAPAASPQDHPEPTGSAAARATAPQRASHHADRATTLIDARTSWLLSTTQIRTFISLKVNMDI